MTIRLMTGLGIATAVLAAPAMAQSVDPARAPVQALSDGLIKIMKGGSRLGFQGRASEIAPVIDRAFDLPFMARASVGPSWNNATAADRAQLIASFRKLTINQYSSNFDSYAGQQFVVDPKVETRGTDKLVKTTLTQPHGESVAIAYRLRQAGGEWKIIDVFYRNSISQLATRRDDFQGIVGKGGVRALIGHVNQLADKAAS
ncbi:ABC transporter substrate-binding protein [Sphingomonas sp. GlSt437]|uniref:ABC transporter substrate-binding protein n=1 Tax=Sphingomonas sp. GlSt437 TaxID=3389970 RepID=UPI003A8C6649